MFEDDFSKMLRDYPEAVADTKVFAGLMKDLFPGQQMQINLINTTYALGIAGEIADAAHINNAFAFRFVKRLVDEYGVSRLNADWAVSVWCVCYGQRLLHKPCDIQISRAKGGAPPAIRENSHPDEGRQYSDLFRYTKIDGGYGVTGFSGQNKKTIIFSSRYNNQTVKQIMPHSFAGCEVCEAVMTDGIEIIGESAFDGCSGLKQVIFPNTLKEIGNDAFRSCPELITAVLPQGVEQLGKYAFSGSGLKTIMIPHSVYWVGEGVYADCKRLNHVAVPDNIISIPDRMFSGCGSLSEIKLPETADRIGTGAFENCSSLQSIVIPESVRSIGENAFGGTHPKFTLLCHRLSEAERYARSHNITFQIIY